MSKYAVMPFNDYVNICDKIRSYTQSSGKISSQSMPEKIREVYNKAENDGYYSGLTLGKKQGKNEAYSEINQDNTRLENAIFATNVENAQNSLTDNVTTTSENFELIKSKIVSKGVEVAEGTPTADYAPKIDEVYEAGRKSKVKEHMDAITDNGKRTNCNYMFAYFNDEMFKLEYPICPTQSQYMFMNASISPSVLKAAWDNGYLDFSQTDMKYLFANTYMTEIPFDVSLLNSETPSYIFGWSKNLHTIKKVIVAETTQINSWFVSCSRLENLITEGTIGQNGLNLKWSTKLSKASWVSIVGCYSTTISGLSMTGSLDSVNKAFETSKGANDGSTSAEWLNLIATRPNVSFNLL